MRLNTYLKRLLTFCLILFLGTLLPLPHAVTAVYADETVEVKLNVNSQTMVKGKTFSLYIYNLCEGQTVSFHSDSPEIASVDADGVITANEVGSATIVATVTDEEGNETILQCDITVGPPAISVQFSKLELLMTVGQKITLERIIQPLNTAESAKFSSYDRSIARVSAGGRVTAVDEGSTYIFAQICNGHFAVCKVYIIAEDAAVPEELLYLTSLSDVSEDAETEVGDPILTDTEDVDFGTFIKNLNSVDKNDEGTETSTDETTN